MGPGVCARLWKLRLITASPGRGCWLVGDWVEKGLLARGLREAGLEQEDRREDWLSECVLTEPWKRVASTSTELSPLVCPGEAAWDLRRGQRGKCSQGSCNPT